VGRVINSGIMRSRRLGRAPEAGFADQAGGGSSGLDSFFDLVSTSNTANSARNDEHYRRQHDNIDSKYK